MTNLWTVFQHHLAIDSGNEILHPSAEEIYKLINGETVEGIKIDNPINSFSSLRFSRIGSPVKCVVKSLGNGEIVLNLFTIRKKQLIPVDYIEGTVIDHGISNDEWFYLTGDCQSISELLVNAGISSTGQISLRQYLMLRQSESNSDYSYIDFEINEDDLKTSSGEDISLPVGLKATLYNYQKTGYEWLRFMVKETGGCLLGDEMGLGKTLQVITVVLSLLRDKQSPILVVAPVSLLENWRLECKRFAPTIRTCIHHGSQRTGLYRELLLYDVVIISYNTAVSDLSMLKMVNWSLVVLDEAQNIKNPYSERAKAVKRIPRNSSIAISGTPFENHILDVWSLVDFVLPGLLGGVTEFQRNYPDDNTGAAKIEPILTPLMLRRLVKDVASDLPEKVIIPQPIKMPDNESNAYETIRMDIMNGDPTGQKVSLGALQKLRMYCTFPSLCDSSVNYSDPTQISLKYQRCCEILEEIVSRHEKALIFTSFKKMFDVFNDDIPSRFGIKIWNINGDTPVEERQEIVDIFNRYSGSAILALNPRAAGTGLNITGANHVIHYNPEWNPAIEDQASARAYRRGQDKTVFIYRLYYSDTVEQLVEERIERKRELATTAIIGNTGGDQDKQDIIAAINMSPGSKRKENIT